MVDFPLAVLSQRKLVNALRADIQACRAEKPRDPVGKEQRERKLHMLTTHLHWTLRVGDDPVELERIVKSLETSKRFHLRKTRSVG